MKMKKNKYKIIMVGNDKSVKGGITTVIEQLLNYNWKKENIEIRFIPTYIEKNNIFKIAFFINSLIKLIFYCMFFKPQKVHIHMSYKGSFYRTYIIHKLCLIFKVKDIIHLHGSEFQKWYNESNEKNKGIIRKLLRECYVLIVLGKEWENTILNIEPQTNIIVINNTISIPNQITKWNNSKFSIMFLGVLIKRKGVDDLLEAIKLIKDKPIEREYEITIVGTGDEENNLKEKCKKLEISNLVEFLGWRNKEQKEKLLKKTQLLVLPSYNEGLPMAILEAISYGIPILGTRVGDVEEAVINGKNGYLIRKGNVNELSEYLYKFINISKIEWEKMSKESKKIAIEKFSDSKYYNVFVELYKS